MKVQDICVLVKQSGIQVISLSHQSWHRVARISGPTQQLLKHIRHMIVSL